MSARSGGINPDVLLQRCRMAALGSQRILMYSHDALGLGHLRRNLLIARALAASGSDSHVLLVTGTSTGNRFTPPHNADFLTLPAVTKGRDGSYSTRTLGVSLPHLIALRSKLIRAAVESFQPDLVIVDNIPRGLAGELDDTLLYLRSHTRAHVVLGLRDVLDDPRAVQREWAQRANYQWINNCYDQVWVYGDKSFYDPVVEYGWGADLAQKVFFTGYLDRRHATDADDEGNNLTRWVRHAHARGNKIVLCLVGGGQDGAALAQVFCNAQLPPQHIGVVVTGPYMSNDVKVELRARLEHRPQWRLASFHSNPAELLPWICGAVAMGGYNTVSELLSYDTPALLVPRRVPRQEQWIRATRLRDRGLVSVADPDHVAAEDISNWISTVHTPMPSARVALDFSGLARIPQFVSTLVGSSRVRLWA